MQVRDAVQVGSEVKHDDKHVQHVYTATHTHRKTEERDPHPKWLLLPCTPYLGLPPYTLHSLLLWYSSFGDKAALPKDAFATHARKGDTCHQLLEVPCLVDPAFAGTDL